MVSFIRPKLLKRIVSALVLGLVSFYVIMQGGVLFLAYLGLWGGVAYHEWFNLARKSKVFPAYAVIGLFYIMIAFWCCYVLRESYPVGVALAFVFMVWSSDVGAYVFGKFIGGAKMSPTLSPNKTWAGLFGALVVPGLFGGFLSWYFGNIFGSHAVGAFFLYGALVGLAGQAGDLIVSALKRQAGAKDTGNIIPGHGGVLDRIDSMILAAPVYLGLMRGMLYVFYS